MYEYISVSIWSLFKKIFLSFSVVLCMSCARQDTTQNGMLTHLALEGSTSQKCSNSWSAFFMIDIKMGFNQLMDITLIVSHTPYQDNSNVKSRLKNIEKMMETLREDSNNVSINRNGWVNHQTILVLKHKAILIYTKTLCHYALTF